MRTAAVRAVLVLIVMMFAGLVHADSDLPRRGQLGVRLAQESGVVRVESVYSGSAAEEGGLRPGDVIFAVDGGQVKEPRELIDLLAPMLAGRNIAVTVERDGRQVMLSLSLKERPRDRGQSFDVLYEHVVSGAARLRTIVTRPHAPGRHPVLFFIQGQGPVTIDQPLSGPEPYNRILNEFATSGYVTVRVEKPGVGDSEGGPFGEVDFETELDAYRQAMTHVRQYTFIEKVRKGP